MGCLARLGDSHDAGGGQGYAGDEREMVGAKERRLAGRRKSDP